MQVLNVNGSATQLANRWNLSHVICSYEMYWENFLLCPDYLNT